MGYTTEFVGQFSFDKPLQAGQVEALTEFAEADHRKGVNGEPGNYCQWIPTSDGSGLVWDQNEKFYDYIEWLEFLIERFVKPWGYVLNGAVDWQGEVSEDQGVLHVKDNRVLAVKNVIVKPDPAWKIEKPEPKWS